MNQLWTIRSLGSNIILPALILVGYITKRHEAIQFQPLFYKWGNGNAKFWKTISQRSWCQGVRTKELQSLHFSPSPPGPPALLTSPPYLALSWLRGALTSGPPDRWCRNTQASLPPAHSQASDFNERSSYYQATVVYSQLFRLPFPAETRHPAPVLLLWETHKLQSPLLSRKLPGGNWTET